MQEVNATLHPTIRKKNIDNLKILTRMNVLQLILLLVFRLNKNKYNQSKYKVWIQQKQTCLNHRLEADKLQNRWTAPRKL